ncbi:CoA-disulfide reductase [Exiguobacterium acetylicum]|uniref:CoA-disulfide reductase n=1 Tax=Exiguobacterium acetylicum TaxID=41170 RepID=UPI001CA73ABB|nr:CoA-disulfide reductase [Exiguobacterium acetylicum]QZY86611.1 CoA-disulfide reductase [Exiguobacterium acetylicum]
MKTIIVGGVAGGATAAARLRRIDETAEIILLERGKEISFANCGLPYYIGDVIKDRNKLLVQTPEGMHARFNLDVRNLSEAIRINREAKTVTIRNVETGEEYDESYDHLILSPGAKPIRPNIPGLEDATNVFTLRNIPDTDRMREYVDTTRPERAVVIGGGFIGLEMAENLVERGAHVTLVEMADQVMAPVDPEMAAIVHEHLRAKGVELILEDGVARFEEAGRRVVLTSGRVIETEMNILSIGVAPESTLAADAGLTLGIKQTIQVDDQLRTSDPSIFAIGDAIEVKDYITKEATHVPLAWPANRQGRLVADIIAGRDVRYSGTLGTAVAKVFDLTVASTGNNEKRLRQLGLRYEAVHLHPGSHAGYYPGASPISMKLLFDPIEGTIYGAQAIGMTGVEKRIDVLATAIKGGLTVLDLPDLELSYAPPYSSAKDPVNMAGYIASNIVLGDSANVHWHEIDAIVANGGLLLDVREPSENELGAIPGSINISLPTLREKLTDLPKDQTIYVTCQVGLRGYVASQLLQQHGYDVKNLSGGYKTWSVVRRDQEARSQAKEETAVTVTKREPTTKTAPEQVTLLDTCGLQCPGPILELKTKIDQMTDGEQIFVKASDPGFLPDVQAWAKKLGHTVHSAEMNQGVVEVMLEKGQGETPAPAPVQVNPADDATMVVFSGDLDKALASFVIAQGAQAMGKQVTMFFTFWGLNIIRKPDAPAVEKAGIERMMGMMMPKHAGELPLSNMNMAGAGQKMMKKVMKDKQVDALETMMAKAQAAGVRMIACTMSMDIMGIKKEELLDGIDYGGVASYLGATDGANLNLFI